MEKKVSKKDLSTKEALDFLKKNLEAKVEDFQKKCLELRKAEQEALEKAEKRKLDKGGMVGMDALGPAPSGNQMSMAEKKMEKSAPPGREDQVKELKGKVDNPYAVAWASYKKGKAKRDAKKVEKMDSPWDEVISSAPAPGPARKKGTPPPVPAKAKLAPVISSAPAPAPVKKDEVGSVNAELGGFKSLVPKKPAPAKDKVPKLPGMTKNDTLIDPKNQNDHEKRLKTIEGGEKSVLPGDKKVAEPFKGEGSGGEPKPLKMKKSDFAGPGDATFAGKKKPKGLAENKAHGGSLEPSLSPLVPQGQEPGQQLANIKTALAERKHKLGPLKKSENLKKEHIGFDKLKEKVEGEGYSADSAAKIAASVGRKKYGAHKMAEAAHEGKPANKVKKDENVVKEKIVREDGDGKETIVREEKPVKKAAPSMLPPKPPKAGGALGMSNPGGTPGGAMKTDSPMPLMKPAMKMRKSAEMYLKKKKAMKNCGPDMKKDELSGLAGMGMQQGPASLGPGGSIVQNAAGTSSGAGMGGGPSPKTSMDMIGSKPVGAPPNPTPQRGGPLGGVGRM